MAKLSLSCPCSTTAGGTGTIAVDKQALVRTGGNLKRNTPLSLENPGSGWVVSGDVVTYSGANEFVNTSQVYHNGDLQLTSTTPGPESDVYFVSASGSVIAFGFRIDKNDIIQVWKFAASGTT